VIVLGLVVAVVTIDLPVIVVAICPIHAALQQRVVVVFAPVGRGFVDGTIRAYDARVINAIVAELAVALEITILDSLPASGRGSASDRQPNHHTTQVN